MKRMRTQPPKIVLCELGETTIPGLQSYSPFCLKVHRALGIAGLAYESRHGAPAHFRDLNPAGQVPVLLVDGEPFADSTRILARIDQLSADAGGPSLLPQDRRARAEAWLWEDYADRALSGYVVAARWADDHNWPLVREAYFKGAPWFVRALIAPRIRSRVLSALVARDVLRAGEEALWDDYRRSLDQLEARAPLDGFWVTSDAPSVADIGLFGMLQSLRTPLTQAQAREIVLRPALTDWLDRVDAVAFPARERAAAIDGLTATRGHDMTRACRSRTPTHVQA
jgi:glutathione S-transferase